MATYASIHLPTGAQIREQRAEQLRVRLANENAQKWYDVLRQAYNSAPRGWARDFFVQEFLFKFCRTGYDHTDPAVLAEIHRIMFIHDLQYAADPLYGGPAFPMPPMTVTLLTRLDRPDAAQQQGITTAMNPYGTAFKVLFKLVPAGQTDQEKEALTTARMAVMQHLQKADLAKSNNSAQTKNTEDEMEFLLAFQDYDVEAET